MIENLLGSIWSKLNWLTYKSHISRAYKENFSSFNIKIVPIDIVNVVVLDHDLKTGEQLSSKEVLNCKEILQIKLYFYMNKKCFLLITIFYVRCE